ncbi:hypothetical protein LCGC14_3000820, partial [marine sediment metagenome]
MSVQSATLTARANFKSILRNMDAAAKRAEKMNKAFLDVSKAMGTAEKVTRKYNKTVGKLGSSQGVTSRQANKLLVAIKSNTAAVRRMTTTLTPAIAKIRQIG